MHLDNGKINLSRREVELICSTPPAVVREFGAHALQTTIETAASVSDGIIMTRFFERYRRFPEDYELILALDALFSTYVSILDTEEDRGVLLDLFSYQSVDDVTEDDIPGFDQRTVERGIAEEALSVLG